MLSEQKFKDLVDTTDSSISFNDNDIEDLEFLYNHYRIPYTTSSSQDEMINHLSDQIKIHLISGNLKVIYLWRLRDQVILRSILDDQPLQPYFSILKRILEVINMEDKILPLESEEEWRMAIRNVKDYNAICGENYVLDIEYFKTLFPRQFSVASSAKVLRNYGYKLEVKDGKICIEESEQEKIARSIECDIQLIGGLEIARRLFYEIQNLYDSEQERYHLVRRLEACNNNPQPEIPIGYLLNLCVKHLQKSPILSPNPKENWERMVKLSTSFTSVLDVQPYNSFQVYFKTLDNLSDFLQEIAVYDSIFCLNQLRPSDVPRILRGLFSLINVDDINKIQVQLGWIPEQAILVAEAILNIDVDNLSPIIFTKEQVKDQLPDLYTTVIEKILDIYCHSHNPANSEYKIPTDFRHKKYTFFLKPLLKLDRSEYVLMGRSWCSPAFYEALVDTLNKINIPHNIHNNMGDYLERFVKEQLQTLKIKYSYGDYSVDSRKYKTSRQQGECDIIIESDDTIIFIEIKKKSLTNNAKGGCDAAIFADLAGSLLDSQIQLGWHEIIIRSEGYLELTPKNEPNNTYRLELNGRSIERVTLTLLDFGGFQDRNFLYQFLQLMLSTSSIDALDSPNAQEIINRSRINQKLPIFLTQHEHLKSLNPRQEQFPFYDCWFLSLPQFLILIDDLSEKKSIKKLLHTTKYISTTSLNFYFEYANAKKLLH
ncbi:MULTISPECIES: hypothetical protein [unclassified Microcoleus]|uniref:hypothetical protein n=1 Tax=unclassified Microcoleus TaxID=2642155 RepID=UPI002FD7780A